MLLKLRHRVNKFSGNYSLPIDETRVSSHRKVEYFLQRGSKTYQLYKIIVYIEYIYIYV